MNPTIKKVVGEASGYAGTVGFGAPPPPPAQEPPASAVQKVTGANPAHAAEERREVVIGREILTALEQMLPMTRRDRMVQQIEKLARELITMHGA